MSDQGQSHISLDQLTNDMPVGYGLRFDISKHNDRKLRMLYRKLAGISLFYMLLF